MSTTKLHINLKQGIVEAEGTEEFVEKIYRDFKDNIAASVNKVEHEDAVVSKAKPTVKAKKAPVKKSNTKKSKTKSSDAVLVKDLDLTGGKNNESLRDFYEKYVIKSNMERNLIFTYYLSNVVGLKDFGVNHIFTCYRNINGIKIPGNLKQSLYDTSAKGWIAVKSVDDDITVPVMGVNYIEHDLPKAGDK